jgi:hypothetical protein
MSTRALAETGDNTLPGAATTSLCRSSAASAVRRPPRCSAASSPTTASGVAALSDVRLNLGGVYVDGDQKIGLDRPEHGADAKGIGTP